MFSRRIGIAGFALCAVLCFGLCSCTTGPVLDDEGANVGVIEEIEQEGGSMWMPNELVGLFDSKKEAREAAELYGIELESYEYGVAVFICEGDPEALIEEGKKNGWPELSLNQVYTVDGGPAEAEGPE